MDWTKTFFSVIDLRSFSSIWYWIVLAVFWSQASYWVVGLPFDLIQRARRLGGEALADVEAMAAINARRMLSLIEESGPWLMGFVFFFHSVMLTLALVYDIQICLAIELLLVPMTGVGVLSLFTLRRIAAEGAVGARLLRILFLHRFWTQLIGMCAIFVSAMVGMFRLLYVVPI